MHEFILVTFVIWAACGFLAYGRTLAHFQTEFPFLAADNRGFAWLMAACGPIGLLISLIYGRHGFMWRLPPKGK